MSATVHSMPGSSIMESWARYCVRQGTMMSTYFAGCELLLDPEGGAYWVERGFAATLSALETGAALGLTAAEPYRVRV